MSTTLEQLYTSLKQLIGLHRQLLESCRAEREALTLADVKRIQEATVAKQGLVDAIRMAENQRIQSVAALAMLWKKPIRDLSLPNIIIQIQGTDPKSADNLRSSFNALTFIVQRIIEQNDDNKALVERSLANVNEMKRNVLGEAVPKSNTYTAQGQRGGGINGGARLISHKA